MPDKRDGRRYLATRTDGSLVDVTVLDRDQEGAGLGYRAWRLLRVRGPAAGRTYVSVRRSLEHEALLAYASAAAGARTPKLVATSEVGAYAALLAFEHVDGRPLVGGPARGGHRRRCSPTRGTSSPACGGARRAPRLHQRQPARLPRRTAFTCWPCAAARSPPPTSPLRIDVAQLLTALALVVGPERAVSSGALRLGTEPLAEALPVLQPLALSLTTPAGSAARQGCCCTRCATQVLEALPRGAEVPTEDVRLERLPLRTLFVIVGGSIAGYILLSQLSNVDLANLMATADWRWAGVALVVLGADLRRRGLQPHRLRPRSRSRGSGRSSPRSRRPSSAWSHRRRSVGWRSTRASCRRPASTRRSPWPRSGSGRPWRSSSTSSCSCCSASSPGPRAETSFDPPQGAILGVVLLILVAAVVVSPAVGAARRRHAASTEVAGRVIPALVAVGAAPEQAGRGHRRQPPAQPGLLRCAGRVRAGLRRRRWRGRRSPSSTSPAARSARSRRRRAASVRSRRRCRPASRRPGSTATTAVSAVLLFRVVTYWLPVAPGWVAFQFLQRRDAI